MNECILLSAAPHVQLRDVALAIVIASLSQEVPQVFVCRDLDCSDFDFTRLAKGAVVSAPSLLYLELEDPGSLELSEFRRRVANVGCEARGLSLQGRLAVYEASMKCSQSLTQQFGDDWKHSRDVAWLMAMTLILGVRDRSPQLAGLLYDFTFLENVDRWSDRLIDLYLKSTKSLSEQEWTQFINDLLQEQLLIAS